VSTYDNDPRIHSHPDGSRMVFADDHSAEYKGLQNRRGQWDSYDFYGRPLRFASDKATELRPRPAVHRDPTP
jgi:hypothetical protein